MFQYIPSHINPQNRKWTAGEKITLRTQRGEWTVVLAISNGRPRCSSDWKKFAKDNELKYNKTLPFTMIGGKHNGVIFDVQIR